MNRPIQSSLIQVELIIRYWLVQRRSRSHLTLKVASREWVADRAGKFRAYLRRHRVGFQQGANMCHHLDRSKIAA